MGSQFVCPHAQKWSVTGDFIGRVGMALGHPVTNCLILLSLVALGHHS